MAKLLVVLVLLLSPAVAFGQSAKGATFEANAGVGGDKPPPQPTSLARAALAAAKRGDCNLAAALAERVRDLDDRYYETNVANQIEPSCALSRAPAPAPAPPTTDPPGTPPRRVSGLNLAVQVGIGVDEVHVPGVSRTVSSTTRPYRDDYVVPSVRLGLNVGRFSIDLGLGARLERGSYRWLWHVGARFFILERGLRPYVFGRSGNTSRLCPTCGGGNPSADFLAVGAGAELVTTSGLTLFLEMGPARAVSQGVNRPSLFMSAGIGYRFRIGQ